MGVCNCSMFCCTLLYVHSSIAIILMGKREPVALLNLSSWCLVMVAYKEIVPCWIPSHIGIQGNEMVDKQAKTSLSLEPTSFKISFNKFILKEWQTSWNNSIGNKLLDFKPTIGEYQSVVRNTRKEEVVLARLRLGHTRATHSYLLQGESSHNVLVVTHHSLYVTSFWNVATLHK